MNKIELAQMDFHQEELLQDDRLYETLNKHADRPGRPRTISN